MILRLYHERYVAFGTAWVSRTPIPPLARWRGLRVRSVYLPGGILGRGWGALVDVKVTPAVGYKALSAIWFCKHGMLQVLGCTPDVLYYRILKKQRVPKGFDS